MSEAQPNRPLLDPDILPALISDLEDMVDGRNVPHDIEQRVKFLSQLALDLATALQREYRLRLAVRAYPDSHDATADGTKGMQRGT